MTQRKPRRITGKLTQADKRRHADIRAHVEKEKPRLMREALVKKTELALLHNAMLMLKKQREAKGLSLADIAERSGIDKSRLSKLENDPQANPTMNTLTRIAKAIGVKLSISVDAA